VTRRTGVSRESEGERAVACELDSRGGQPTDWRAGPARPPLARCKDAGGARVRSAHLPPPPGRVGCSLPRCEQAGKLATGWVFARSGPATAARPPPPPCGAGDPGSAPRRDPRVWVVACAGVAACGGTHPRVACGLHAPPPRGISRAATPARCSAARIGPSFVCSGAFTRVVYPLFFLFLHRGSGGLVRRRGACTWKVGAATVALKIRRDYK